MTGHYVHTQGCRTPSAASPVRHAIVDTHGVADPLERFWREDRLASEPLPLERWLEDALACLFRPVAESGFWDEGTDRFVTALRASDLDGPPNGREWSPVRGTRLRAVPVALQRVLRWRASSIGTAVYDEHLYRLLEYGRSLWADDVLRGRLSPAARGALLEASCLAADSFDDRWLADARAGFEVSRSTEVTDRADAPFVTGVAALAERTDDGAVREALAAYLDSLERVHVAAEWGAHRDLQETVVALARGASVLGRPDTLALAGETLAATVDRRLRSDGAFRPADASLVRRLTWRLLAAGPTAPAVREWHLLAPVNQSLFASAVGAYTAAGGQRSFDDTVDAALRWLVSGNPLEADLFEASGLGVPVPVVTVDGRTDVPGHRAKGVDEVAALVEALTTVLTATDETDSSPLSASPPVSDSGDDHAVRSPA
ncbi:hypothetical protein [Natronobiforma cellulositropha]|uniref:hypothetical protein n=1 Tax=Natronobiforma cellulositropha TaxID=1679076 RepID=UPI0021D57E14|nr:hypothetical protein [Natronobiforma cellulositropha]